MERERASARERDRASETRYTGFYFFSFFTFFCRLVILLLSFFRGDKTAFIYTIYIFFCVYRLMIYSQTQYIDLEFSISQLRFSHAQTNLHTPNYIQLCTNTTHTHNKYTKPFCLVNFHLSVVFYFVVFFPFLFLLFAFFLRQETKNVLNDRHTNWRRGLLLSFV